LRQPGYEALILRRTFPELEKTHLRRMAAEEWDLNGRPTDRKSRPHAEFVESKRLMRFTNGSMIECGHMDDAAAVSKYLSTEYHCIVPDEGSTFEPNPLLELSTRARRVSPDGTEKGKFWVVSNPGGPASATLLDFFIDHQPDFDAYPKLRDKYDPAQWVFVPGRLDDNPYLDPDYEASLAVLQPWRYEQLRNGDWRVFSGQFFSEWQERIHVAALEPSREARWFRSLDWGRNQPGCVLWWAQLPDHALYLRREWKFQGMSEQEVAVGIRAIDRELGLERLAYTAADPSIVNQTGATHQQGSFQGQSIGETLGHYKVPVVKADNDRFNGWGRCHALLRLAPSGVPWLQVHPECRYLIRSIAGAVSDPKDPDDVDTASDDHALDAWRYGAMSRPHPLGTKKARVRYAEGTMGALRQAVTAGSRRLGSESVRRAS
jgi:hypothetical protein